MSDTVTVCSKKASTHFSSNALLNKALDSTAIDTATLLIKCKDQAGIVQAVSEFIHRYGANIITLDQYSTAHEGGQYFMRLEFALAGLSEIIDNFQASFAHTVAKRHNMAWQLHDNAIKLKVGILVSKFDHALLDLLWRHQRGLLDCHITSVVSNHDDLRQAVENFGITFHHVPITKENKVAAEAQIHELMAGNDLLVLARYMQILSSDFVKRWPMQIINIHHSFLPAFIGAKPYERAFERGVKLIGATSHYVTNDLDEGPIIEQDIERVDHRDTVADLKKTGQQVERRVLAKAVKWHLQDRIIVKNNTTIVFH